MSSAKMKVKGNSIIFAFKNKTLSIGLQMWADATKTKFKKHLKEKLTKEQIDSAWEVIKSSK